MSLFTPSLTQATDNNGDPISGAKWWFYLSGSSTPINVYADSAQTTSLGSSVTADASGWFVPIYFATGVTYRAVLKTPAGATIGGHDIDPVDLGGSSGSAAAYLTVESFGAVGDGTTNDQASIQDAIDYAITNGIAEVRFMSKAYACKAQTFVAGGFGGINPTGAMINIDGSLNASPVSIRLASGCGGSTITRIGYATGGDPDLDAEAQQVSGNPHRGGGINLYGTQANAGAAYTDQDQWAIQLFEMEGITIDGARVTGGKIAASTDTSDKGVFTFNAVRKIVLKNCTITNFGHELLYGGGTGYGSGTLYPMTVHLENIRAVTSGHSCLNFQDANLTDINGEYGDAYIAAEQYGCDSKFIGTVFRDSGQLNYSAADRSLTPGGETYDYPAQGTSLRKTQLVGVTQRNVDIAYIGPYTYGSINAVDSQCSVTPLGFSIDLDITHTIDQTNNFTPLVINGPAAVPSSYRTGMVPKDLTIRLSCKATVAAVAAGHNYGSIIRFGGYLDPDSCKVIVDCSATADLATAASSTQRAMPHIIFNSWTPVSTNTQLVPGYSTGGITSSAIDVYQCGATLYPNGTAGGEDMTFTLPTAGTYTGLAGGQKFYFKHGNSAGRFNFAKAGTGMALTRKRVCFQAGDGIIFEYDKRLDKLIDVGGYTSDYLEGSATQNWASIASGGTATATVTVTGAALGDKVDSISHGVDLQGMTCTGYVSAADTVTLVMQNPTAGAIDLASTTVRVLVQRV